MNEFLASLSSLVPFVKAYLVFVLSIGLLGVLATIGFFVYVAIDTRKGMKRIRGGKLRL